MQNCGRVGHIARTCPSGSGGGFASRAPPPGRALNTSTLPPVKCYRCGGPNHVAKYALAVVLWSSFSSDYRDCLAPPGITAESVPTGPAAKFRTCYKCQQEGHVRFPFIPWHIYSLSYYRLPGNVPTIILSLLVEKLVEPCNIIPFLRCL